ncbi:MAG: hypothetical protein AB7E24_11905, partial [Novosphingobium sp.]
MNNADPANISATGIKKVKTKSLLLLASACLMPLPALAADDDTGTDAPPAQEARVNQMTTGVARARDRLDSATST